MGSNIDRLAYLATMEKKPFDLLLEIIELECFSYDFKELETSTDKGESVKDIIFKKYSIEIYDAILTKWIENYFELADKKLILKNSVGFIENKMSKIKREEEEFLNKVSCVRTKFINYAKDSFDMKITNEEAKVIFDDYIYSVAQEQELKNNKKNQYFIFQDFLKQLFKEDRESLEIIENFGIANQIKNIIINNDTPNPNFLKGYVIFIDTPIMMKLLGYDGLDLSNNYTEIIELLGKAGATVKIFEHTFEEIWGILFNFKRCIAQNILDGKGVNTFLKARKEFYERKNIELSLDKDDIRKNINALGIEIFDTNKDDDLENVSTYDDWQFDESDFERILINKDRNYENYKTRLEKDIQSISSISRLRHRNKKHDKKNTQFYFLVDNYVLIQSINTYHKEKNEHQLKNELLLENTILFDLWQNLQQGNSSLSKSLFRSKCFALNTIDEKFKDTLYREARKIEAYNSELEISDVFIDSPDIEEEIFKITLKDKKINEQYLSKIMENKVAEKRKKYEKEINKKNTEIDSLKKENELAKNQHQDEIREIYDESKKGNISCIKNLIENSLKKSTRIKLIIFFGQIFCKKFDKNRFLWDQACEILKIDVEYIESYFN